MTNQLGVFTKNYHLESTKVPIGEFKFIFDNCNYYTYVHEYNTVKSLIHATEINLQSLIAQQYTIYAKPFYSYLYDRDLLEVYNVSNAVLQHIKPHHCVFTSYIQANQRTDNQTYLNNGIKHNVVDAIKLLQHLK